MTSSPVPQEPYTSGNERAAGPAPQRPQQLAWGPPSSQPQSGRRGLAPISTTLSSTSQRPSSSSQSPRNPWSPSASGFGGSAVTLNRSVGRSPSTSSGSSLFGPSNTGQPQAQAVSHFRNIASSTNTHSASNAPSSYGSGATGSAGSGGPPRLSRASPSISQSATLAVSSSVANPTGQSGSQTGSLSKIVVAQLVLLLSTMDKDKDKAKFDSQYDQVRKVTDFTSASNTSD